jgi:NADPH-dependent curcumin reductase CurA
LVLTTIQTIQQHVSTTTPKQIDTASEKHIMAPTETKQWILKSRPKDLPTYKGDNANFQLETKSLSELQDGQLLIKTLLMSNDPAQRAWLNETKGLYVAPVPLNGPMRARGICEVLESKSDKFKVGDKVSCTMGWVQYAVVDDKECLPTPEPPEGLNYSHYLGALGGTGLTAYYGLVVIGEAKAGQTLVVSGAAGATGSMVVQIAKGIVGCGKIIGLAGSDEKCRWVEKLGADNCINYKAKDWKEQLGEACGKDGVDIYFDNVAGETLDEMLANLKQGGVVVACGGISGYNDEEPTVLKSERFPHW